MSDESRSGAVLFGKQVDRLAAFYSNVLGLREAGRDDDHVLLESPGFQLVVHRIPAAWPARDPADSSARRVTAAFKPVFFVPSLTTVREVVDAHGGKMEPPEKEWSFGAVTVCDAVDPDGNVIQFREHPRPVMTGIAPFFIVRHVPTALAFYRDRLGFDVAFQGPTDDDIFFGIVRRGAAMIILKHIGVEPIANFTRDIRQGIARWDAYVNVPDPDALAAEFASRGVEFFRSLSENDGGDDDLRGFEVQDADGYVLFFGRPNAR